MQELMLAQCQDLSVHVQFEGTTTGTGTAGARVAVLVVMPVLEAPPLETKSYQGSRRTQRCTECHMFLLFSQTHAEEDNL